MYRYATIYIVSLLHDKMWQSFYTLRQKDNIKIVHNEEGCSCRLDSCGWLIRTVLKYHKTWEIRAIAEELLSCDVLIRILYRQIQPNYEFAHNWLDNSHFVHFSQGRPISECFPYRHTWTSCYTSKTLRDRKMGFTIKQGWMILRKSSHILYIIHVIQLGNVRTVILSC